MTATVNATRVAKLGAIQSDAALRQSMEPRQMAAASATGRYWQFFRRPLKFAFRFASITITVSNSEGNLKEAAVIETSHVTKNPQRECITLDRTLPSWFNPRSADISRLAAVTASVVSIDQKALG
jgi:hypothetical protein